MNRKELMPHHLQKYTHELHQLARLLLALNHRQRDAECAALRGQFPPSARARMKTRTVTGPLRRSKNGEHFK
jgi:hypothetical protein